MDATIKIMIVDDHEQFTAGLSAVLRLLGKGIDIEEFSCGRQALTRLEGGVCPDVLLVDLDMPTISGLDLMHVIAKRSLNLKFAVVSASTNSRAIQNAMDCGAVGFIPKSLSPQLMLEGLEAVLRGQVYLPEHLRSQIQIHKNRRNKPCKQYIGDKEGTKDSSACEPVYVTDDIVKRGTKLD